MSKLKKSNFLEGAFIATLCIIISKILGVLYVIPFYKIIGEQGGTLYGYAYNIYNVFLTISTAGIPLAISKLTSEYNTLKMNDKKALMYKMSTRIISIFSISAFLICFIFAPNLSNLIIGNLEGGNTLEDVTFVIRLISFALLVIPFLGVERGYLQGLRYIKEPSISQVIEQFVRIIIIIIGSYSCVYIFHLPIRYAVGISVFAACLGGLATFIYLKKITISNKSQLDINNNIKATKQEKNEVIKKIIIYSIPFVIINLANTLYTSTDMVLIIRTLPKLGFSAVDTEFITSVFTTWGVKFNTIVLSIANGMVVSLVPNIVKDYNEKNMSAVNDNFNKCLKIVILVIIPLTIFISSMSNSIWNIFYGASELGPKVIKYSIIVIIFDCLYAIVNSLLQSLNKSKIIYFSVILGILINLALDIPLMVLFNKLNLPAYYGAITATIIGLFTSNAISIIYLNNKMNFEYHETFKTVPTFFISAIVLILMLHGFNQILPVGSSNRLVQIVNVIIAGIVCGGVYFIINFKSLQELLPKKLLKKLHLI